MYRVRLGLAGSGFGFVEPHARPPAFICKILYFNQLISIWSSGIVNKMCTNRAKIITEVTWQLRVPFMEVVLMAGSVTVPAPANPGTLHPGSWHYLGQGLSISYSFCNLSRRNPPTFSTTTTTHLHNHYGAPLPLPLPSTATATATAITTTELEMHVSSLRRFFFFFCGQAKSKSFLGLQINRQ